jgi:O-antigen/teichoic acid export membrane protein
MSRTRRAMVGMTFSYVQSAVTVAGALVLMPVIIARLGSSQYGAWLAMLEMVGYATLVDLGLLATLPWLVAERDGRRDQPGVGKITGDALAVALLTAAAYFVAASLLWVAAPRLMVNVREHWPAVRFPLAVVLSANALAYPVRVFWAVLSGLQDVVFLGSLNIAQAIVGVVLTLVLLWYDFGLYALAVALAAPTVVMLAAIPRISYIAPHVFRSWSRPERGRLLSLAREGIGTWMGQIGWRMAAASSSLVVLSLGPPSLAVIYACTAKLGSTFMPLLWQVNDSALVGLAQLQGEGRPERVREVVATMARVSLVLAGATACGILAINPAFVVAWVGADKFGGHRLNFVLCGCVIAYTFMRVLFTAAAALGRRTEVGAYTLLLGAVDLGSALVLGRKFGLAGVAASGLVSSLLVSIPIGSRLLRVAAGLPVQELVGAIIVPWSVRAMLLLGASAVAGLISIHSPVGALPLALIVVVAYLLIMRPLYADVPLPVWLRPVLTRLRLVPAQ